ncbi:tetratricopeptide repeat protein [Catellatospora citrea]|nr:tetratricopeptide repeat protein [Catellatospora citrea]
MPDIAAANRDFHHRDGRWEKARRLASGADDVAGVRAETAQSLGGLATATRTLPRDVASFTGRERELESLMDIARISTTEGAVVGVHSIGGMAGVGKTAFVVRAGHLMSGMFPDGQIFLQLHGHTAGQRPVDPADALASLLQTAGLSAKEIPTGLDMRARMWRDYLAARRLLIVLDDAIGYDQVSPLLPGTGESMVLITSRRHLTALTDAHVINLETLPPHDAAQLFARVASRTDLMLDESAVMPIVEAAGYLPLAISLLASQLRHHPTWTATDLLADILAARNRLELMAAENVSVTAALELSYQDLTVEQGRLFRRIGMHPGTDLDRYAAAALDAVDVSTARRQLEVLYDYNLLTQPVHGRFRAHDLVREYARGLAAAENAAKAEAAGKRLLSYYLYTARLADTFLERRAAAGVPEVQIDPPPWVPDIRSTRAAGAWMNNEIANLFAAAEHAALHGWPAITVALSSSVHGFLRGRSQLDQAAAFHSSALRAAHDLDDPLAEASILTDSGGFQRLFGDPNGAVECLRRAVDIYRSAGDALGEANALDELAASQVRIGEYANASDNLTRAQGLYRDLGDRRGEAHALNHLGAMQDVVGDYHAALASQDKALALYIDVDYLVGAANAANELGYVQRLIGDYGAAAASQERAIELARTAGFPSGEADALSELGAVQIATGNLTLAATTLAQASRQCRSIGYRRGEAAVLLSLGAVQYTLGEHEEARANLSRALRLYRDARDRLGEAKALNAIGETALPDEAVASHQEALTLATEIRSPEERARALEGLATHHLNRNEHEEAEDLLKQSLASYRQTSSPRVRNVESLLSELEGSRSVDKPQRPDGTLRPDGTSS